MVHVINVVLLVILLEHADTIEDQDPTPGDIAL